MRKIYKTHEPTSLADYKRKNPTHQYSNLTDEVRQDIRKQCTEEQYYLCAYCCKEISGTNVDTMNEHIQPRHRFPNLSMDFNNIVASCSKTKHCDDSKGGQILYLTPLMDECETEFEFRLNGTVIGKTKRAMQAIEILKLNEKTLCETRKLVIDSILYYHGLGNPIDVEDDELLLSVIDDINQPENGKLQAFAPIAVNCIKQELKRKWKP